MTLETMNLDQLRPSDTNRELGDITELTASVRELGVLQPILVRPIPAKGKANGHWQVIAGHRRFAAAKAAGLERIPVVVREVGDQEALEIQIIENLEREGLHPLDEAEGYERLAKLGHKLETLAKRMSRGVPYVYQRLKLLQLTPLAKRLFRENRFTVAHALLLARLNKEQQQEAISADPDRFRPAMFTDDRAAGDLFDDDGNMKPNPYDLLKPVSVGEFEKWVNDHVRFTPKNVDPVLFPEAAQKLKEEPKAIPVTHSNYLAPETRDGRTYSPRSWKDATEKGCEYQRLGYIAVGRERGRVLPVCINKDKCTVHWKAEKAERTRNRNARAARGVEPAHAETRKKDDPALVKLLQEAHAEAEKEIDKAIVAAAGKLKPEEFVRLLCQHSWEFASGARRLAEITGTKLAFGRNAGKAAFQKAPLHLLIQAYVLGSDLAGLADELGVDASKAYAAYEKAARDVYAKSKGGPAKVLGKPYAKKKGAKK